MKRLLAIFIFCCILVSCTAKEDMPVQILAQELGEEIENFDNLAEADDDYIKHCMNSDLSLYSEYIVMSPSQGDAYNEFGIFKVKDMNDINKGIEEVKKYLNFKKENFDAKYSTDEYKKIENAKVTRFGKYILFTALNEAESKEVEKEFRDKLR